MTFTPAHSRRILLTLFFAQLLFSGALIAINTLLSITADELSGSESLAGLPQSINPLAQAMMAMPIGYLMGRYGRRYGLSMGYLLAVIGALVGVLAVQAHSFGLLLLSAGFIGASRAGTEQSRFTAAEVYPETRRSSIIGLVVWAGTGGAIFGPLLVVPAEHWADLLGLNPDGGAWALATVFFAVALLIVFTMLRPDPREIARAMSLAVDAASLTPPTPARPLRQIFQDSNVRLALASMLIAQTVMVGLMVMTPLQMKHHDHGKEAISLVIMAHTLGMFGLSPLTGWLIDRFGQINMILAGAAILILSAVLAPLSTEMPLLTTALFLLGLGWNFCFISGSSLLSVSLSTDERAQAQGVNEMLIALSASLGSLLSGPLFDVGGFVVVCAAGFALTLALTGFIGTLAPTVVKPRVIESV
jgi:MFS family permease